MTTKKEVGPKLQKKPVSGPEVESMLRFSVFKVMEVQSQRLVWFRTEQAFWMGGKTLLRIEIKSSSL